MKIRLKDFFLIPNILSILRLMLIPFIIYFLSFKDKESIIICLLLFFLSGITDFFDGYLSRKYKMQSDLGRLLDPLADKLLIISVAIGLHVFRELSLWFLFLLLFKDILTIIAGLYVIKRYDIVVESRTAGKITTTLVMITILFFIIYPKKTIIKDILVYISSISVLITLIDYSASLIRKMRSNRD